MENREYMHENKKIAGYLEVLKKLSSTTDSYVYVMDLQKQQLWYLRDMEVHFDLVRRDTSRDYYDVEEWVQIIHPKDREAFVDDVAQIMQGKKQTHDMDYRVRNKEGRYFWINCRGNVEPDEEGRPFVMLGRVVKDILRYEMYSERMDGLKTLESSSLPSTLKFIQAFFYNMKEYVYVTDMDTNELVYVNRRVLRQFGFQSEEDYKGKKCYEVLQGSASPCTFCTNAVLRPWEFKEWRFYNSLLNKHLLLKDTVITDGEKHYRIEIAMDVTRQVQIDEALDKFQNIERMASEGVRLAFEAPTPDAGIDTILEYLGKALDGHRAYVFEKDEKGNDHNTYEWTAAGVQPQKQNLQDIPPEVCQPWYTRFEAGQRVMIESLEKIKDKDPLLYEYLEPQGICSIVVVPIYDNNKIVGFWGVDNPPADAIEYTYDLLQLTGYFITSSLKRRNLLKQMYDLGHQDYLTKLGNRLAMNEYLEVIDLQNSMGVLYGDITGLKRVNDTIGHDAGDELIKNACKCLQLVFEKEKLFRIGGDELLVLCEGMEEAELYRRVESLKNRLQEQNVVLAIGTAYKAAAVHDISIGQLIYDAEQRMYKDKGNYYKEHGIERRKY